MFQHIRKFPYYANKAVREAITWAYSAPDTWQRRAARAPLDQAHRVIRRYSEQTQPCTYIVSGVSKTNQQLLKVAFVGRWQIHTEPSLDRYASFIFQEGTAARHEAGPFQGSFLRQAERIASQVDLLALVGNAGEIRPPAQGEWQVSSAALRQIFDFRSGETWEDVVTRAGLDDLRSQIQEAGLRWHISHRQADFAHFYHAIYTPTVLKQHVGFGDRMTEAEARALFDEHPSLLIIENPKGQVIAGTLAYPAYRTLHCSLKGVMGGSLSLIEDGALSGLDYFGMQWAHESGCTRYDGGAVPPFQQENGAAETQIRGWRYTPDPWRTEKVLLWVPPGSQAGTAWLRVNPIRPSGVQSKETTLASQGSSALSLPLAQVPATGASFPVTASANPDYYQVEVFGKISKEIQRPIDHGLYEHALAAIGQEMGKKYKPFSIGIKNKENQVIGGLIGRFTWNYLHVDSLWVSADYRGRDLGTRLMLLAENAARSEGMEYITLETTSFEAIGFYPRLGFEIVGQIEGIPPGHTFYYLKKKVV